MHISSRFILAILLTASSALAADNEQMREKISALLRENAKDASKTPPAAPIRSEEQDKKDKAAKEKAKDDKVVALPQLQVVGKRVPEQTETTKEAKIMVQELDKKIEKEKKNTVPTSTDKLLNSGTISKLGDRSATEAAVAAKDNVHEMEVKQSVAAVAVDPNSEEENKKLMEMLKDLEYKKMEENNSRRSSERSRQ